MNPEDVQIETFTSGVNCPVFVKAWHRPTRIVAEASSHSGYLAKRSALAKLRSRVEADPRPHGSESPKENC